VLVAAKGSPTKGMPDRDVYYPATEDLKPDTPTSRQFCKLLISLERETGFANRRPSAWEEKTNPKKINNLRSNDRYTEA
jgi:hypothetical protein